MKILMQPISLIAVFETAGNPRPIKFQINNKGTETTIKIDMICKCEEQHYAGEKALIYKCQSLINGKDVVYELKYLKTTCKWFLYKI